MKRFWKDAEVSAAGNGFTVSLDARPIRTPAKAPLVLPSRALAEAVAGEWLGQGETVRPDTMPLTRAANTAIDRVSEHHPEVAAIVAAYGDTDLLCYRAPHPQELADLQAASWDPVLDWAADAVGARLAVGKGVMHVAQEASAMAALGRAVEAHDAWELTALHDLVTLSGSLVLGLAVSYGRLAPDEAWPLSRIDEDWNIREWGEDAEAYASAERRRGEFEMAAKLLALVRAA